MIIPEVYDRQTNSPCRHLRKYIENGMENIDTDVMVSRVKLLCYVCLFNVLSILKRD